MTFDSRQFREKPGEVVFEDRFRLVQLAVGFKKLVCHRCDFAAVYKYQVQQLRRKDAPEAGNEEETRPDHQQLWETIPRFAEIPETIHCKRCREVIGLYTECIF